MYLCYNISRFCPLFKAGIYLCENCQLEKHQWDNRLAKGWVAPCNQKNHGENFNCCFWNNLSLSTLVVLSNIDLVQLQPLLSLTENNKWFLRVSNDLRQNPDLLLSLKYCDFSGQNVKDCLYQSDVLLLFLIYLEVLNGKVGWHSCFRCWCQPASGNQREVTTNTNHYYLPITCREKWLFPLCYLFNSH